MHAATATATAPQFEEAEDSQPATLPRPRTYLPELEALRGAAIVLVVVHHAVGIVEGGFAISLGKQPVSLLRAFGVGGGTGVTLFFVLSAFLLSLPFLAEADGERRVDRRAFYRNRVLRIVPLFWTVVVAVAWRQYPLVDVPRVVWPFLLFLGGYALDALSPFSGVWWSLYTEVQFYLVLPLLASIGALGGRRGRRIATIAAAVWALAYLAFLWRGPVSMPAGWYERVSHSLFGMAPAFGCGIAAAWIYRRWGGRMRAWAAARYAIAHGGADAVLALVLAILGTLLQAIAWHGLAYIEIGFWHTWHLAEACCWAAIVLLTLVAPLRSKPLFCNRAFERLGALSYSIYLLHVPALSLGIRELRTAGIVPAAGWSRATAVATLGLCSACLALATLTYHVIERPFLARKTRPG